MFDKFPNCLKVAFIDCDDKGVYADADVVHEKQERRYYSCLIDGACRTLDDGRKEPRFRIELPGYPILGDGKGDNQNHAIPFSRGTFSQCIDANQGAYFEQMLLLPVALAEFRSRSRGDGGGKRIIGLPEHITSDIGSVGHMAASAELAFGTIPQRTYSVLGARMHYGHPDLMNKLFMMQQGGVSKATKTLNLSEDIFAGMDFTLRGQDRMIRHCEYFHLAKGRDLGFNTVLAFFSKLSSGAGEQIITRQMFRLGQVFHLPELLSFYYGHVGYYFTQFFVSWSMPLLVLVWQLVLLSDCEGSWDTFLKCGEHLPDKMSAVEVMARTLSIWFSWLLLLFLIATSLPYFVEVSLERGILNASKSFVKQMLTLAPLLFIFQSKIIGYYITNELRFGGAKYVSTGRGLPTERRPFIGEIADEGLKLKKVGGLYLDYAIYTYYDGAKLLLGAILIFVAGGASEATSTRAESYVSQLGWMWLSLGLTIASWLYAPFIFNPYQFVAQHFWTDLRAWAAFFVEDNGRNWVKWHDENHFKTRGLLSSVSEIGFFFSVLFLAVWYATVNLKVGLLATIYSEYPYFAMLQHWGTLLPPVSLSLLYCGIVALAEARRGQRAASKTQDPELGMVPAASDAQPTADPQSARYCTRTPHLAMSAVVVCVLDILEALLAVRALYSIGWTKAFLASIMLKYTLLSSCLYLCEGLMGSERFKKFGYLALMVRLWVRAHRMIRDILTSSIILIGLTPAVLANCLNEYCCAGCSCHQLLVYRDPGHLWREEEDVVDVIPPPAWSMASHRERINSELNHIDHVPVASAEYSDVRDLAEPPEIQMAREPVTAVAQVSIEQDEDKIKAEFPDIHIDMSGVHEALPQGSGTGSNDRRQRVADRPSLAEIATEASEQPPLSSALSKPSNEPRGVVASVLCGESAEEVRHATEICTKESLAEVDEGLEGAAGGAGEPLTHSREHIADDSTNLSCPPALTRSCASPAPAATSCKPPTTSADQICANESSAEVDEGLEGITSVAKAPPTHSREHVAGDLASLSYPPALTHPRASPAPVATSCKPPTMSAPAQVGGRARSNTLVSTDSSVFSV
jgi:hypothetical protein